MTGGQFAEKPHSHFTNFFFQATKYSALNTVPTYTA